MSKGICDSFTVKSTSLPFSIPRFFVPFLHGKTTDKMEQTNVIENLFFCESYLGRVFRPKRDADEREGSLAMRNL